MPYEFFYGIFSDLTPGGIRSCLQILLRKKYVIKNTLNGQSFFKISDAGSSKLQLLHPGLGKVQKNNTKDVSTVLLITQAPGEKRELQKLRKLLRQYMFTFITRGAYFYPFKDLPESLFKILVDEFSASVMIMKVVEFSLAKPDSTKMDYAKEKRAKNQLSGISRETGELIDFINSSKYSSVRAKSRFYSLCKKVSRILCDESLILLDGETLPKWLSQMRGEVGNILSPLFFSQN